MDNQVLKVSFIQILFAEILNVKLDLNVIESCISVYDCTGSLVHRYYGEKGVTSNQYGKLILRFV